MKILNLSIRNFGRLSEQSFDLKDGCNTILRENGWGKSTLASFIKVMFYGFDGESKRGETDNERKRFKPWQGGVYGGSMVFEARGREYLVQRVFGAKASEDVFELYDNKTKLKSSDFSERLGDELFRLDSASFRKTILIGQNDLETSTTDSINARMGNLTGVTDDINNFEKVSAAIKEKLNHMSPKRSTGALAKMKSEELLLQQDLRTLPALDARIDQLDASIDEEQQKLAKLDEGLKDLQTRQQKALREAAYAEKKAQYDAVCVNYREREESLKEAAAAFPGGIPDSAELSAELVRAKDLRDLELKCSLSEPDEESKALLLRCKPSFENGVPEDSAIDESSALALKLGDMQREYDALQFSEQEQSDYDALFPVFYGKDAAAEAERSIAEWQQRSEKKSALGSKKATLQALKSIAAQSKPKKQSRLWLGLLIAGTVLLAAGAGAGFGTGSLQQGLGSTVSIICLAALISGAILAVIGLVLKIGSARIVEKAPADESETAIAGLEQEIADDEEAINSAEASVKAFLEKFGRGYDENSVLSTLYGIKTDCARFAELTAKKDDQRDDELLAEIKKSTAQIEAFLAPYQMLLNPMDDLRSRLTALKGCAASYRAALAKAMEYRALKEQCREAAAPLDAYISKLGLAGGGLHAFDVLSDAKRALAEYINAQREFDAVSDEKLRIKHAEDFPLIQAAVKRDEKAYLAELEEQLSSYRAGQRQLNEKIKDYYLQKSSCLEQHDRLEEKAAKLAALKEEEAVLSENFEILSLTKDLLEEAKTNFTKEYAKPISGRFSAYYEAIEGHPADGFEFDANSNLIINDGGLRRDIHMYSAGSRDKLNLCFRAALTDVMFKDEAPLLIMDDPFTNLDGERLAGAKKVLRMLSGKYQILYLTCHESRAV